MAAKTFQHLPLEQETRSAIPTDAAAWHLNRAQQTLRLWHCKGKYPPGLRPSVVNGRLAWPVAGIKAVLGVSA